MQHYSQMLGEVEADVSHQPLCHGLWVDIMLTFGLSDEDLVLAKKAYAFSLRTCAFCGSKTAPLAKCSGCKEVRYCIGTDCQIQHWNNTPREESHKALCSRIYMPGSRGRTGRGGE